MRLLCVIFFLILSHQNYAQLLSKEKLDTLQAFTSIEKALENPDIVYKLVLKRKKFDSLPADILRFSNLQYLNLRGNRFTAFPKEISQLKQLQWLDMSHNKMDTLYPEIGDLSNLYHLNMNNNKLESLPPEIGKLNKLEKLDLWGNYLMNFPEEMRNLSSLKVLDLRSIILNDEDHQYLFKLLPLTKIHFSHSCNCNK